MKEKKKLLTDMFNSFYFWAGLIAGLSIGYLLSTIILHLHYLARLIDK